LATAVEGGVTVAEAATGCDWHELRTETAAASTTTTER
jgi:DNA-binding transcriptional regulator YdaS (Cro superfamily)